MENILHIGQWQGFFQYGSGYGEFISGQEVEFRLFIEEYKDGIFSGRIIDWDGYEADGEVSYVKGFVENHFISFTKQYDRHLTFDEMGNTVIVEGSDGLQVVYEGRFDEKNNRFIGKWEIINAALHTPVITVEYVAKGTWEMQRQD